MGGGVGRLFRIGKQPISASLQAYANVVKPDMFGDVTVRAQIQFLFPKLMGGCLIVMRRILAGQALPVSSRPVCHDPLPGHLWRQPDGRPKPRPGGQYCRPRPQMC